MLKHHFIIWVNAAASILFIWILTLVMSFEQQNVSLSQNFTPYLLLWHWNENSSSAKLMNLPLLYKTCGKKCIFTDDATLLNASHAVFFQGFRLDFRSKTVEINGTKTQIPINIPEYRNPNQFYIYYNMEPAMRDPLTTKAYQNFFNWTMNYRHDADFPVTHGEFIRKPSKQIDSFELDPELISRAASRSAVPVAWLVSNCKSVSSNRSGMTEELKKYIPVDIYGRCGDKKCNEMREECYKDLAKSHKFYLAFENALCFDYVTEKFFYALKFGMVPVVYGKANYGHDFPPGTFINVDSFASARGLAQYLKYLDGNPEEYLNYFRWRKFYTVRADIKKNQHFCDACERVIQEYNSGATYNVNINDWLYRPDSYAPLCSKPPQEF